MTEQATLFDLTDPAYLANPYPTWAQMRSEAPVYWTKGFWWLTRYDDCVAALKDLRFSSDRTEAQLREVDPADRPRTSYYEKMRRGMMLFVDPPDHTRLRRLVARAFTPRASEALRPRIQQITNELLAAAPADFDAMGDLALPLPYYVIADMIGVPREDRAQVKAWSTDFGRALSAFTPEIGFQADAGLRAFSDYLRPIVNRLRNSSEPNLFSILVAAEEDGEKLSEDELFATAMLLIMAGHETTTMLIANSIRLLLSNPDQLQLLRDTPTLIDSAIDEVLRYAGPVPFTVRVAKEDFAFGGQHITQGERATIFLASANRDPAIFPDPDRFDITRDPNPHLGFGDFIHKCMGAPLALIEGQVAISTLVQRYPELRFAETCTAAQRSFSQLGDSVQTLPIHLGQRAEG